MLKLILFTGIIFAISWEIHTAADTSENEEETLKIELIESGFHNAEINKLLPIFWTYYHVTNPTTEKYRSFYVSHKVITLKCLWHCKTQENLIKKNSIRQHSACQALDLKGKTIEFPESPGKEQDQLAWKELEADSNLAQQLNYWKLYRKMNNLGGLKWKAMVFVSIVAVLKLVFL